MKANNQMSKRITRLVFWAGFIIIQECLILVAYAIHKNFTATAAYLTAAVGVAEAMIMAVANRYLKLAESEHTEGGITFEAAKSNNFNSDDSI